jgi:hypothetical protein
MVLKLKLGATTVIINGQVGSFEGNSITNFIWCGRMCLKTKENNFVQKLMLVHLQLMCEVFHWYSGNRTLEIVVELQAGQGYVLRKFSNKTTAD